MMRLAAIVFLIFVSAPATAESRFAKPIELPEFEAEELVAVSLDGDVYAKAIDNYADLRLLDAEDHEVAYVVRRKQTERTREVKETWAAENVALKPLADDGVEITFRSDPKKHPQSPQGIRLVTPISNFEHHVRVEASEDGENWETIVDDGLVFDYSQYMDVQNLAIELPNVLEEHREFYRLTIADVTQEQESQLVELTRSLQGEDETRRTERMMINRQPFRIDRIELWHNAMKRDVLRDSEVEYPVALDRTEQDTDKKLTYLYLKSRREPLTKISIVTPARNFSRPARIEVARGAGDARSWQPLGSTMLSRLDFRTLQRESLAVDIPETRAEEYRLVIDNRDSLPLDVTGVVGHGHDYEVVFLADTDEKYRLAYDGTTRSPPYYDTAALTASLAEGFKPLVASLGNQSEIEALPTIEEPFVKRMLNNSLALTVVIGVLVLLLAAGLYRATRHLEEMKES